MKFITLMSILCLPLLLTACMTTHDTVSGHDVHSSASTTYTIAQNQDIIGKNRTITVRTGDTLTNIAGRYSVGMQEMLDANASVDSKTRQLKVGQKLVIPGRYILPPAKYRNGIVINVAEMRLYYFSPDGRHVSTYPVSLGREGWRTPLGSTYVYSKKPNPTWNVPESIRKHYAAQGEILPKQVPPGDENPLGKYAIYLGMQGYLIHGTNAPWNIGKYVSSGCIRMRNHDVEELFYQVDRGTPVHIIYAPNKAGWASGKLYLESHTPASDGEPNYQTNETAKAAVSDAQAKVSAHVDDKVIEQVSNTHSGLPIVVGYHG
jgi:L,D-transpeptidase ErfK/SrfK